MRNRSRCSRCNPGRSYYGGDSRSGTVRAFGSGGGGGGLDSGLMDGMSHLEPLEHSVLNAARGNCSRMEASVCELLEHSDLGR